MDMTRDAVEFHASTTTGPGADTDDSRSEHRDSSMSTLAAPVPARAPGPVPVVPR
jgi:hypothetical protein